MAGQTRPSSSRIKTRARWPRPAPPYSWGTITPVMPILPNSGRRSVGNSPVSSMASIRGLISLSANSRVVLRRSSSRSDNLKSITISLLGIIFPKSGYVDLFGYSLSSPYFFFIASSIAGGTRPVTEPPRLAASLTMVEEM